MYTFPDYIGGSWKNLTVTQPPCVTFCCFASPYSASAAQAQDHTVLAGNYYYNPATLTVTAETIEFLNEAGFHNVNGVSSTLGDMEQSRDLFLEANSGAACGVHGDHYPEHARHLSI